MLSKDKGFPPRFPEKHFSESNFPETTTKPIPNYHLPGLSNSRWSDFQFTKLTFSRNPVVSVF